MRPIAYLTDLGLYSEEAFLGPKGRRVIVTLAIYLALAGGIFFRQISAFPSIDLRIENLRGSVVVASIVLALVVAPPLMRWISRKHHGQPSWEHVAWSVTYGFFSDLLLHKIIAEVPNLAK